MTAKTQTTIDINTYCVLWYKYHKSRIEKCCTVASPKDWNLCVKRKTCSNKTLRSISRCQNPPYRVGKSAEISPIMTRWLSWAFSLEYLSTISSADEITKTEALNECFFVAYFFGASRVWRSYSRTQPYYLQWPRYLDEEQERHGLKQNPMYI